MYKENCWLTTQSGEVVIKTWANTISITNTRAEINTLCRTRGLRPETVLLCYYDNHDVCVIVVDSRSIMSQEGVRQVEEMKAACRGLTVELASL